MKQPRRSAVGPIACAGAEALEGRLLLSVSLVKDINTGTADLLPRLFGAVGQTVYFGSSGSGSNAFYQTDGTESGTQEITPPWTGNTAPLAIVAAGAGKTFLPVGNQLWVTAGSMADAQLVRQFTALNQVPYNFSAVNGRLFFVARGETSPFASDQLWVSDGTAAGTVQLTTQSSAVHSLVPVGSRIFFLASTSTTSTVNQLWVSDGTAAGTLPVTNQSAGIAAFVPLGNQVIFATAGQLAQVFVNDGTAGGTAALSGMLPGPIGLANAGSVAYFMPVYSSFNAGTVWKTDGTPAGTSMVGHFPVGQYAVGPIGEPNGTLFFTGPYNSTARTATFYSATPTSGFVQLGSVAPLGGTSVWLGSRLVFIGNSGTQSGVWVSDGTPQGTFLLEPEDPNNSIHEIDQIGALAYFRYDDGVHGAELWKTDGTPQGTTLVKDINRFGSGLPPVNSFQRLVVGQELYFPGSDGVHGVELWKTDGTDADTVMVKDLNTAPASSNPLFLTDVDGTLYFSATDEQGTRPWRSDGTAARTERLGDFTGQYSPTLDPLAGSDGHIFFMRPSDLWAGGGTEAGTSQVLSLGYSQGFLDRTVFAISGGKLFFKVAHQATGMNLATDDVWVSDGTPAGTMLLQNVGSGESISNFVALPGGGVEFLVTGISASVWKSDGTPQGTMPVSASQNFNSPASEPIATIEPGAAFLNGDYYVGVRFMAPPPIPPNPPPQFPPYYQLWRLGPSGNLKLEDLPSGSTGDSGVANLDSTLLFVTNGTLYRSDGTAGDTTPLVQLPNNLISVGLPPYPALVVANSRVFFVTVTFDANSLTYPLWSSDGTAAGTSQVATLRSRPAQWAAGPDVMFFVTQGGEIWASDGTPDGTGVIANFPVSVTIPAPMNLTVSGSHLFFSAMDAAHGSELWAAGMAGSIAGSVFDDANHNGVRDSGEDGLAGVTVYLDANNNGVLDPGEPSVVTATDGLYAFTGLQPGATVVREVPPAGWRRTTPAVDSGSVVVHAALAGAGPLFGDVQVSTVPMNIDYLLTLAQHYGQQGTFATGDVTGDGQVNFDDLLMVVQNYGHPLSAGTASVAAAEDLFLLNKGRSLPRRRSAR